MSHSGTYRAAIEEAIRFRNTWQTPVAIWMHTDNDENSPLPPTTIRFEAFAQSIHPDGFEEIFTTLDAEELENLADMLENEPYEGAFDEMLTEMLRYQSEARN